MKNRHSNREPSLDPLSKMAATAAEAMAERTWMSKELLQALAQAIAANERAQRRFRTMVLISLSKIQTTVEMIHGAQIVESLKSQRGFEDKVTELGKAAEDYISQHSQEVGQKMVKYVYDDSDAPAPADEPGKKRRA